MDRRIRIREENFCTETPAKSLLYERALTQIYGIIRSKFNVI